MQTLGHDFEPCPLLISVSSEGQRMGVIEIILLILISFLFWISLGLAKGQFLSS